MGYVLRLRELVPLLEDLMALGREITVRASEGEVIFCVHVPHLSEDLQRVWKDFLLSYARALKAKHDLPIEVEDRGDWVELRVRTV